MLCWSLDQFNIPNYYKLYNVPDRQDICVSWSDIGWKRKQRLPDGIPEFVFSIWSIIHAVGCGFELRTRRTVKKFSEKYLALLNLIFSNNRKKSQIDTNQGSISLITSIFRCDEKLWSVFTASAFDRPPNCHELSHINYFTTSF